LIADTLLLMQLRWQLAWNTFKSRNLALRILSVLGTVLIVVVGAGISAAAGVGAGVVLRSFPDPELGGLVPGLILSVVAFLLLLSSFGVALGSLFLSSDIDLLMAAPVDRRAVFISKLLDGMTLYYGIAFVVAFPALLTYGLGMGYGPAYYLLTVVAIFATPLLPAGLGALLVLVIARFAPARRVKEILGLVGALVGIACGLLGQTSRFWIGEVDVTQNGATAWLEGLRGVAGWPFPTLLAGRGLDSAGMGDWLPASATFTGFIALTLGFFLVCVLVADRLYAAGWVRMQSSGTAKRSRERVEQAASNPGLLGRVPAYMAIALKDWRVVPRDLRNFAQMLSPLLFLPVIYLNLLGDSERNGHGPSSGLEALGANGVGAAGVLIAAGVLGSTVMVFGRLTTTGISREGKSWWLLKVAPVSASELLWGKYVTALIPYAILSSLLMFGAALWKAFDPVWFLYGWAGVQILGAGLLALDVGLAVPWARLDWDDPRKMSSGVGALLSLVGWLLLALTAGALLCLPVIAEVFQPSLVVPAALLGLLLALLVCLAVGWSGFRFGVSRLADVGES